MNRKSPLIIIAVAFTCIFMGGLTGAVTNMVNGAVSPLYFKTIMRWNDVQNVWRASIAQGILEGLLYGVIFALIFATVFGTVTKGDYPYIKVLRYLIGIFFAVLVCWGIGGLIAMGLATLSPEFYKRAFFGVPDEFGPMLCYAWVGGSIWGAMFGGLLSAILGSVIFRTHWLKKYNESN